MCTYARVFFFEQKKWFERGDFVSFWIKISFGIVRRSFLKDYDPKNKLDKNMLDVVIVDQT